MTFASIKCRTWCTTRKHPWAGHLTPGRNNSFISKAGSDTYFNLHPFIRRSSHVGSVLKMTFRKIQNNHPEI